jgi:hypothetical protein
LPPLQLNFFSILLLRAMLPVVAPACTTFLTLLFFVTETTRWQSPRKTLAAASAENFGSSRPPFCNSSARARKLAMMVQLEDAILDVEGRRNVAFLAERKAAKEWHLRKDEKTGNGEASRSCLRKALMSHRVAAKLDCGRNRL